MASSIRVVIGGERLDHRRLSSVKIIEALNEHARCTVQFEQTRERPPVLEAYLGAEFSVSTVSQDTSEYSIFEGFVLEVEVTSEQNQNFICCIEGISHSFALELSQGERYWRNQTLQKVAEDLCDSCGLNPSVTVSDTSRKNYMQIGESDFSFLRRLADSCHAWIKPIKNGVHIASSFQPGHSVTWSGEYGLQFFKISAQLGNYGWRGVHYDPAKMKSTLCESPEPSVDLTGAMSELADAQRHASRDRLPPGYSVFDGRARTREEYETFLKRESIRALGGRLKAYGRSRTEGLRAGDELTVVGTPEGEGKYGIFRVEHNWIAQDQGYTNDFWCTPWKSWSGRMPEPATIAGVIPARVKSNNDPERMGRIQVQFDWLIEGETDWVRCSAPHAGAERGFLFLPEVGDEVLVAFEQGDPERPYVIGCLWNGVDKAPHHDFWEDDVRANDAKRLVTKSGLRIQFSDKPQRETLTVATPRDLRISLIEKSDETQRPVILIRSDTGDLVLSAPNGRIHLQSKFLSREIGSKPTQSAAGPRSAPQVGTSAGEAGSGKPVLAASSVSPARSVSKAAPSSLAPERAQFLNQIAPAAIASQKSTGVPASITMAQAILESSWGNSALAKNAFNFFGIKGEGPAGHVLMKTGEVVNGKHIMVNAKFRKYHDLEESFQDHGEFLKSNERYAPAFNNTSDARAFADAIAKAGYATDPKYADKLTGLMEKYDLTRFDQAASGPTTGGKTP